MLTVRPDLVTMDVAQPGYVGDQLSIVPVVFVKGFRVAGSAANLRYFHFSAFSFWFSKIPVIKGSKSMIEPRITIADHPP